LYSSMNTFDEYTSLYTRYCIHQWIHLMNTRHCIHAIVFINEYIWWIHVIVYTLLYSSMNTFERWTHFLDEYTFLMNTFEMTSHIRPTQSIMYVPLQVSRSQKRILLIVQYKYRKSCSGDFYSPESDPPHKIMRYWVYYSTQLVWGLPPDRICQVAMICIGGVPVLKRHFGGAGP